MPRTGTGLEYSLATLMIANGIGDEALSALQMFVDVTTEKSHPFDETGYAVIRSAMQAGL